MKCLPRLVEGLGGTDCLREPPESLLRPSRELPESISEYLGGYFEQILAKSHFFQKGTCLKNPDISISGKKAAGGPAAETARSFS